MVYSSRTKTVISNCIHKCKLFTEANFKKKYLLDYYEIIILDHIKKYIQCLVILISASYINELITHNIFFLNRIIY